MYLKLNCDEKWSFLDAVVLQKLFDEDKMLPRYAFSTSFAQFSKMQSWEKKSAKNAWKLRTLLNLNLSESDIFDESASPKAVLSFLGALSRFFFDEAMKSIVARNPWLSKYRLMNLGDSFILLFPKKSHFRLEFSGMRWILNTFLTLCH